MTPATSSKLLPALASTKRQPSAETHSWHAARVARRLVARHGFVAALRRASDRVERYRVRVAASATFITSDPGRLIYWELVIANMGRLAFPPMPREMVADLVEAARRGYAA